MTETIRLISAKTEDLDAPTRASIIHVCLEAHQEEDFKNLFNYVPSGGLHFLAYRNELLVSHAMVTTRWLQPGDHPLLKTAYIDAVSTLPLYQGCGYGSAVMRKLASEINDEYDIACLETERVAFYEQLGWQIWQCPLAGRSDHGLIPTPEQKGIMVLKLSHTPPLNLDLLLSIECQHTRIW